MKRKKSNVIQKFRTVLASFAVLLVFIFPAYVTARWIDTVAFGNDPRKVQQFEQFNVRPEMAQDPLIDPLKKPLLTITFDDGWESAYSEGLPIMQRYGIISTQYILSDEFDNPIYISEAQARSFMGYNHEIASHSATHPDLTLLDDADLYSEVVTSKNELSKKFGYISNFAPPLGSTNNHTTDLIKKNYASLRNTDGGLDVIDDSDVNTIKNFDRYNINAYTVRKGDDVNDLRKIIDYAIKNNSWVVLTYHQIDNSDSDYAVSPDMFEEHMHYLYNQDIQTATMRQSLSKLKSNGL